MFKASLRSMLLVFVCMEWGESELSWALLGSPVLIRAQPVRRLASGLSFQELPAKGGMTRTPEHQNASSKVLGRVVRMEGRHGPELYVPEQ